MSNDLTPRDFWPRHLPSLFGDDFWPQSFAAGSGLSLSEDDDHVYVEAAVPGLESKDISLNLHRGVLTISGESKLDDSSKRHYRQMQTGYSYQVSLPSQVKEDTEPNAELKNGILTITFDKTPEEKPRQIKIKE